MCRTRPDIDPVTTDTTASTDPRDHRHADQYADDEYAELVELLTGEPDTMSVQAPMGAPISGENETQFEALFTALR